jgi:formate dehydrogenase subunit gamma
MAATTRRPDRRRDRAASLLVRFDGVERTVHWVNAALFLILVATGAILYLEPLQAAVGRRGLIEDIHVYSGLALPIPLLVALSGWWGRALRDDLRRFNRWSKDDRHWVRALFRPGPERRLELRTLRVGKFNAGQKLNAAFVAGAGLVSLGTGVIMRWYHPWPLSWRTGATFVHDWLAISIGIVIIGHVGMALRDPDALRSMFTGMISRSWVRRHAPAWADGEDGPPPQGDAVGPVLEREIPDHDVEARAATTRSADSGPIG